MLLSFPLYLQQLQSEISQIDKKGGKSWEHYAALIWQKEASDKSDISRKRAKCVCHLHWRQWNIMMSYLTYLLVGWVFLHEIWPGRRAHYVNYKNINNSNLDGMSLTSFCQSRAVWCSGSRSRLAIRRSGVRIPLGAYALRQCILSTIVSLDPGVVNVYPARISSFQCSSRWKAAWGLKLG